MVQAHAMINNLYHVVSIFVKPVVKVTLPGSSARIFILVLKCLVAMVIVYQISPVMVTVML